MKDFSGEGNYMEQKLKVERRQNVKKEEEGKFVEPGKP
jgi:hypothetical protein